jgi:glycosyltransferase involved in cell wall biosynthesis
MTYSNWLTKLIENAEVKQKFNKEVLYPIFQASQSLKLDDKALKPSFFDISYKQYLMDLVKNFNDNRNDTKVTIGIMTKNQEDKIQNTIERSLDFCDCLIVVDTGSTDSTVDKINELKSEKIKLYEIPWFDDFAGMRNKIIELNDNRWLFFIDSDERIDDKENFQLLKNSLNLIDILSEGYHVSLQIKQWASKFSSFSFIDRIIRKNDKTEFYGKVHEGVQALEGDLIPIHFDFQVYNTGLEKDEMEKFDKKNKYKKLTLELLAEEPDNPRWIANMTNPDENTTFGELKEYANFLKKGFLIEPEKGITLSNLRESEYLHSILVKYLLTHIANQENDKAIVESRVALKRFPQSTFILFIYHMGKYQKNLQEKNLLFEELLIDISSLDIDESEEVSQQKQDLIESLVVKYMFDFHNYSSVEGLIAEISDAAALENIRFEKNIIDSLFKLNSDLK